MQFKSYFVVGLRGCHHDILRGIDLCQRLLISSISITSNSLECVAHKEVSAICNLQYNEFACSVPGRSGHAGIGIGKFQ
jgi:hypothetical protein